MAVFEYTALNAKGRKTSGMIDADSRVAAQEKLKHKKLFPVSLDRIESAGKKTAGGRQAGLKGLNLSFVSKVSPAEVSMITRQLATLLAAGFPLIKAVATLVPQARSRAFQRILLRVKDSVEEGASFADALAAHPQAFTPVFINMVRAGETSGTLEIVLERLADFSEKREDTKKKIQAALAYPIFMAVFGFLVLIFLLTYIVPGITQIFTDMNQTLPAPTRLLLGVSAFLKAWWWLVVPAPFLVFAALYAVRRTDRGGLILDRMIIHIPVAGALIKKMIAARFARTLGSLLENGVSLLTALEIARSVTGNRVFSDLVEKAGQTVEQGGSLGAVLEKSRIFPGLATQMIQVGEKSGEMESMLDKSADLFDRDVQNAVTAATSIVEPVIILVMGVVVALIILAVCLPIFEINNLIS